MVRLSNADAIPAHPGFVHRFAECERIHQIITALADRFAGPLRIGLPLLRVAWKRDGQVMV
jgi:hypothetical protein